MASLLGQLHFWSTKNINIVGDDDIGAHCYREKDLNTSDLAGHYQAARQHYAESRDIMWHVKNKRPEKLRDCLKELEEVLSANRIIKTQWRSRRLLQVVASNGSLCYLVMSGGSGDVEKVFVDKSLVGKLSSETLSDAVVTNNFLAFTSPEKARLDYVYLNKPPGEGVRKFEKLTAYDPKVISIDLPGPGGRRLERKLSLNITHDRLLVWCPTSSDEAWPWSPMTSERDRANIAVVMLDRNKADIVAFAKTEFDPIHVMYSVMQSHQMLTIEQAPASGGEISLELCVYETNRDRALRIANKSLPAKNGVIAHGRNHAEDRLVLACDDGTLIMYDYNMKRMHSTLANLVASHVAWHPLGSLVAVGSIRGEIQLFDLGLNLVFYQPVAELPKPVRVLETSHYFKTPQLLSGLSWCPYESQASDGAQACVDSLLLAYESYRQPGNPLGVLQMSMGVMSRGQLTSVELCNEYLKHKQINEAIKLLSWLNWNTEGQTCHVMLQAIMNHLLKLPLNPEREGQLETSLGTFYAPTKPWQEATVLEYRDPLSHLARRFFHHLLRYSRFDKAFLLAVDIGSRDLFMDIHHLARDKGETALAEVARRKAELADTDSAGSPSVEGWDEQEYSDDLSVSDSDGGGDVAATAPPQVAGGRRRGEPRVVQQVTTAELAQEALPPELLDDFSAIIMDDPALWGDESHVARREGAGDETAASVKVIHFGLV